MNLLLPPLTRSIRRDQTSDEALTSVWKVKRAHISWHVVLFSLFASLVASISNGHGVVSAVEPVDEIVAYVVEGTGNGHGRGLSQWGAYGWAVEHGWDWEQILDHYYGGTEMGDIALNQRIRVRLTDFDSSSWMG